MRIRVASIVLGTLMWCAANAADEVYMSDPGHTFASFETGHLGISWIRGRFNASSKVVIDRAARKGSIEAIIDTKSVNTGHDVRDKHIRSDDYLDVDKFPTITFRSSQLRFDGDTLVAADGDLTIMGVTKPAVLKVTLFRCIAHPVNKKEMCGADASTAIKRSEFGIKRGAVGIGDEVKISIQIEAYKS